MRDSNTRPHLLNFPTDIRAQIYLAVLTQTEPVKDADPLHAPYIFVSAQPGDRSIHTSLLQTCHQIHDEAQPVYLLANNFVVRIENWNAAAILPWWEKVQRFREYSFSTPIVDAVRPDLDGDLFIGGKYSRDWEGLLKVAPPRLRGHDVDFRFTRYPVQSWCFR